MTVQEIFLECPFCHKGQIRIKHEVGMVSYRKTSSAAAGSKFIKFRTSDRYEVLENCSVCGKTKKDIQNNLDGETANVSHEDRLKRIRDSGLPTRIEE